MIKLQIVDGSLQVSSNGNIILVTPKNACAIDVLSLYDDIPLAVIYNKYLGTSTNIFTQPLANCVDATDTPFTVNSFIAFVESNFGFDTAGGGCVGAISPFEYNSNLSGIQPILGTNVASGAYATIGGGTLNTASYIGSTIGGGKSNTSDNCYATIGGGNCNSALGKGNFVGGGAYNSTGVSGGGGCGCCGCGCGCVAFGNATVSGIGVALLLASFYSTVGGGKCN